MANTTNFNFELIDFDQAAWHGKEHKNWQLADAVLKRYLTLTNVQGVWDNALSIAVDEVYVDGDLGTLYTAQVAHTTASTDTFATDRIANSAYWELYVDPTATEAGIKLSFTSAVTDADQGSGKVWLNHATPSSATVLYFDDVDVNASNINEWADALDNVSNAQARGVLYLAKYGSSADMMIFNVTGAVTSASTYSKVAVTHVLTVGSFSDADTIGVVFTPSGLDGSGTGTVTSVAAGTGFSFSTITSTGTIAVDGVLEDLDTTGANNADSDFLVGTASGALAWEVPSVARTSLGLVIGTNVLAPNGNGSSLTGMDFPSGTVALFVQTAAPTGWTKGSTHNDKALRVVTGTPSSGGATAFNTVFGSGKTTGAHTLSVAEIPSHQHVPQQWNAGGSGGFEVTSTDDSSSAIALSGAVPSSAVGGGGSHTHTESLNIHYVDVIIATKD